MSPSIKEVAKLAGVTNGTVSRAFNGYNDIRPETKERIMNAAQKLGYTPNVNARSLSAKRPPNIGLIVSGLLEGDSKDSMVFLMLQGVLSYALRNNLEVSLYATDSLEQRAKSYVDFCREHSLSGAILSGITTDDVYLEELIGSGVPSVAIDVPIEGNMTGWVSIDNQAAAKEMTAYMIAKGHDKTVVVSGKRNAAVNKLRMAGVEEAFLEAGIELPPERILFGHFDEQRAYEKVKAYLAQYAKTEGTAFFCFSDIMAMGAMRAIQDMGYSIPEDFSVTGFDGQPISQMLIPALTTVAQDGRKLGHESAAMLHDMMMGDEEGGHRVVSHELVTRNSIRSIID